MAALARLSQAEPSPPDPAYTLARLRALAAHAVRLAGGWSALESYRRIDPGDPFDRAAFAIVADLAPPAEGDTQPLTDVARLAAEFAARRADAEAAWSRYDAVASQAKEIYPAVPELIRAHHDPGLARWRDQLVQEDRAFSWRETPRTDAFDAHVATLDKINAALGVDTAYAAWEAANDAEGAVADRLVATRPLTVQDALLKYSVLLASYATANREEITASAPFFAFLSDLELLAG